MTQEDKKLLLKDLCARLPYGVIIHLIEPNEDEELYCLNIPQEGLYTRNLEHNNVTTLAPIEDIKPYLRPMSSMTEEEKGELLNLLFDKEAKYFYIDKEGLIDGKTLDLMKEGLNYPAFCPINIELYTDFLLSHYFDYCGLISKGLALEAPEGMYN